MPPRYYKEKPYIPSHLERQGMGKIFLSPAAARELLRGDTGSLSASERAQLQKIGFQDGDWHEDEVFGFTFGQARGDFGSDYGQPEDEIPE